MTIIYPFTKLIIKYILPVPYGSCDLCATSPSCFIFLYNPFNEVILEKFILHNINHFKKHGSIVCYANDMYRKILINSGFEIIYRDHECNSIYKLN